ncbi:MAG: hypothetical protein RLY70_614 [Planctomycetota bacterium]
MLINDSGAAKGHAERYRRLEGRRQLAIKPRQNVVVLVQEMDPCPTRQFDRAIPVAADTQSRRVVMVGDAAFRIDGAQLLLDGRFERRVVDNEDFELGQAGGLVEHRLQSHQQFFRGPICRNGNRNQRSIGL